MNINGNHISAISIRLDSFTVLHIAEKRVNNSIVVMAECCRQCCDNRAFDKVSEICEFYHIHNSDLQDSIARIIDFVDGNL